MEKVESIEINSNKVSSIEFKSKSNCQKQSRVEAKRRMEQEYLFTRLVLHGEQ